MSDRRGVGGGAAPGAFSATDAAFEGFAIARRDPLSVLAWSLVCLTFTLVVVISMVLTVGPVMMQIAAQPHAVGQPPADPSRTFALIARAAPFYGLVTLLSLGLYGVLYAAVNRAVLRPGKSFGHLGFGVDELLQVAVLVLVWIAFFAVYIAGVLLTTLLAIAAAAVAKPLSVAAFLVGAAATLALLLYLMVRLSLLSPLALDQKRLAPREAWRMTRGRFWPLLGAYVLAGIVAIVLAIVVFTIVGAVALAVGGLAGAGAVLHPDMTSLASYFGPVQIANVVVSSAFYGLLFALLLGAPASAYAQLSRGARVADVFGEASDRSTSFGTAP